ADSHENPATMDNHRDRPEIMAAANNGMGMSTRFSRTLSATLMYVAIPVMKQGTLAGFVRTSATLEAIDARRADVRKGIALAMVLPVLAALVLGLVVARSFTQPLIDMADASRAVAGGEEAPRLHVQRSDEIGQLADALNTMTEQLHAQIDTIAADR